MEAGRVTVDQHLASGGTMSNAGSKADTDREGKQPTQKKYRDAVRVVRKETDDSKSDGECRNKN